MTDRVKPEVVASRKQEAWRLYQQGQISQALQIAQALQADDYDDAELSYLLGGCHVRLGNITRAIKFFEKSLSFKSDFPFTHIALGAAYDTLGQRDSAIEHYLNALNLNPNQTEALLALGGLYEASGDIDKAKINYKKASEVSSDTGLPFYKLAMIAEQSNETEKAIEYLKKAVDRNPEELQFLIALGEILVKVESYDEANKIFSVVLTLSPHNAKALGGKSISCVRKGDYESASGAIDAALKGDLLIANVAIAFLVVCKHAGRCDEAISYGERCLDRENMTDHARYNIHAQLALAMDNCGLYEGAWHHIQKSKEGNCKVSAYDPVGHKVVIDNLTTAFSSAALFSLPKSNVEDSCSPIFIIGMPRSGTSLVEQILTAHPDVAGGGELPYIGDVISKLPSLVKTGETWPLCIKGISQDQISELSHDYMTRLKEISPGSRFITDKMPHNYYALGLIQLLFPKAKIIHCRRQPLDTCISVYFQNFLVGHEYSDSLFNLGTHYHQYLRLMQHWRDHLSLDFLELDYEELVSKPETMIRELLAHCEIPWDDNCLEFNRNKRRVNTASFDQVRQPINTRSVDRWKNYDEYLDELKLGLERGL